MGLSRRPKQETGQLAIYQLLLEIAQSLSALSSDPKAIQKAINEAYGLEDTEALRAQNAREEICKANAAKQEAEDKMLAAENITKESEKIKADAEKIFESAAQERKRISGVDAELGARALKLHDKETDIKNREAKVLAAQDQLSKQIKSLEIKQLEINEIEKSLKDKADKLRSIVDA